MSFLGTLFSGVDIVGSVAKIADDFHLSGEEKQKFKLDIETLMQKRDAKLQDTLMTELKAKERIIVAELTQGDKLTKWARPMVVYAGLVFMCVNNVVGPWAAHFFGQEIPAIDMPTEFWFAWGGIVATWSVGRTKEKMGIPNKIAGSKSLFDK